MPGAVIGGTRRQPGVPSRYPLENRPYYGDGVFGDRNGGGKVTREEADNAAWFDAHFGPGQATSDDVTATLLNGRSQRFTSVNTHKTHSFAWEQK